MVAHSLQGLIEKHCVPGVSVSILNPNGEIENVVAGISREGVPMTKDTWLEMCSLSKTVGSAIAIQFFLDNGISIDSRVNDVLAQAKSTYQLRTRDPDDQDWADEVTLRQLMDHTALGMHYVPGIKLTDSFPSMLDILEGKAEKHGYPQLFVERAPGEMFKYSGGGYLVLQYVMESLTGTDVATFTRPYLDRLGMAKFGFELTNRPSEDYATGHRDDGTEIESTRFNFPGFAAGAVGTPAALMTFWHHMITAYHDPKVTEPISHEAARLMLDDAHDKGSVQFMNALMGLAVFVMKCGPNRVACHQAANDGFRGVYLVCFDGPDAGKGFTVLTNGDNKSVLVVADVLRQLLLASGWEGLLREPLEQGAQISWKGISQAEIVNQSYKKLVFAAFEAHE